jgi:hypothetical protein
VVESASFKEFADKFPGLFDSLASKPDMWHTSRLVVNLSRKQLFGNLHDVVQGFYKPVNLISFNLAEVFVVH